MSRRSAARGAPALWYQLLRRPLPQTAGALRVDGLDGAGRDPPRPLGRAARRAQSRRRPLVRPGLLPRPGPALAARPLPPLRRAAGSPSSPAPRALPRRPADAHARLSPRRRARGGRARARSCAPSWRPTAPESTPPPRRRAAAVRVPAPAARLRALAPGRHAGARQAARLRPLDQLGARAAARRHGPRARPRARRAPRPRLPGRQPGGAEPGERLERRRARARRADRPRPRDARPRGRGDRLEQLGGQRARARRPAAPLLAGDPHLPPSMPGIWYQVGLELGERDAAAAPRCPGRPGIFMGQNNDVAWTFTNAMADVQDLYIERIDGDRYEFEGEWLPLRASRGGDRGQGPRSRSGCDVRPTHHGPARQRGARRRRRRAAGAALVGARRPVRHRGQTSASSTRAAGRSWSRRSRRTPLPVSNLVWADRHGSIGYKLIGRLPVRRGGCPDLPKPGWSGEYEWDGTVPYDGAARARRPRARLPGHRQQPDRRRRTTRTTSPATTSTATGRAGSSSCSRPPTSTTSRASQRMQADMLSIPGLETAHRLARLRPRDQRETAAIERLRSWDGRMAPDSVAATIYQAFTLRLAREFARAAIGDRDLAERWLDRADNGFITHVTSPWRWQSHLLDALGGGRRRADRPPLGRARARRAARRARRPRRPLRARARRLGAGAGCTR